MMGVTSLPTKAEEGDLPLLQGLPPVVDARTRVMLLGSFPSQASLAAGQYYAHPRNQFWPLLGALWQIELPSLPYAQRLQLLLSRGLGLWDVFAHCQREGSLDSAIRQAQPNDFKALRAMAPAWSAVAHHGGASARMRAHTEALGLAVFQLPSTSPAHAAWSFERKLAAWRQAFAAHGIA